MRRAIALIIIRVTFYSSLKFGALIPCVKKIFPYIYKYKQEIYFSISGYKY